MPSTPSQSAATSHTRPLSPSELLPARKQAVTQIRDHARKRLEEGSSGVLIAATLADRIDQFVVQVADETIAYLTPEHYGRLSAETAVIGVGGTGRHSIAPYSDVDLMLLTSGRVTGFDEVVETFVQALWDSGLKLGQSVRTVAGAMKLAREDDKTATSFVQTSHIWGSDQLHKTFEEAFRNQILHRRKHAFVEGAVQARKSDFPDGRPSLQELEPNVKTSHGGLRDLNLIGWIAKAYHGTTNLAVLQLQQALTPDDALRLQDAEEFLVRTRIRLHLQAGGPEDVLTRNRQLAIAEAEGFEDTDTQRAVEQLMQEYFRHSGAIATIADRFVGLHRRPPWIRRFAGRFLLRRREHGLMVGPTAIDIPVGSTESVESLERVLQVYAIASEGKQRLEPRLTEAIRAAALTFDDELTDVAAECFREILKRPDTLPEILRHMHDTGVLDHVIPQYRGIRALLQFNQYHDFTVDEHTLRAVETVCSFADDDGPLGRAYQRVRNRDTLHLSVFLHDIGKGSQEDHSQRGARMALEVGERLGYDPERTERLSTLVLEHLEMADIAFRRDTTDERLLVDFANRLGSPRTLIKLYLLTAADIMAVGPGTWTPWKAELLADLFERTMVIVSGRNYGGFEEEKIAELRRTVCKYRPDRFEGSREEWTQLVETEFGRFPTHYLMSTDPDRIAHDLAVVSHLGEGDVDVTTYHEDLTGITEYRVILPKTVGGCFQNMCGVLTAKNCEILGAEIATTNDGFVIDGFQVRDRDFVADDSFGDDTAPESELQRRTGPQPIPDYRLQEVQNLLRAVLTGDRDAENLFAKYERFGTFREDEELASGLTTRIRIDNDTSTDRTIIDVFTKDRRGLLYFLAKSIGELELSVELAKIATHFDQVVDVFYVTERDGTKLSAERVAQVREKLTAAMNWFDDEGFREFRRD